MSTLQQVTVALPSAGGFAETLLDFLSPLGSVSGSGILLPVAQGSAPSIALLERDGAHACVEFTLADGAVLSVDVLNSTGEERHSSHAYEAIPVSAIRERLAGATFGHCDHVGFDLPWFGSGAHPEIETLRQNLAARCAYHRSFSGEEWDFILPATLDEVTGAVSFDYHKERRTKFEIVSIDKVSTPIIQMDFTVRLSFEQLTARFPEAIADPDLRNVWVYVANPFEFDVCLVIGEPTESDWSHLFDGCRIQVAGMVTRREQR